MNKDSVTPPADQGINWSEIRNRMETARQALAQDAALSSQESRAILKARARLLAPAPQPAAAAQASLEIVEFRLATETYGLASAFIREVYPVKELTPLPGLPPFVLGIVNVRGQILSIIDLKKFFDLPAKGLGRLNRLIILRSEQMEFGILADDILGARTVALEAIQAVPPTISGIGAEYLRGVTAEGVILLDAERILNDEKIIVHQGAE